MKPAQGLPWDHDDLRVAGDTEWRAGCRLLQTWWRQEVLGVSAYGPHAKSNDPATVPRLVGSTLALDAPPEANFVDLQVLAEVEARLNQKGWGGLVSEDRVRRNLLSSQPLAFNLFGSLKQHPRAVLAWLSSIGIDAVEAEVRIEWAPPRKAHLGTGSAFDAAVIYLTAAGVKGLVAVEVKYSEDLEAQRIAPNDHVLDATRTNGHWRTGSSDPLREPRLSQIWLNALLAQSCALNMEEGITEDLTVVMACAADTKALRATADVRAELADPAGLMWCPFESVLSSLGAVEETNEWTDWFRLRYLDFAPVADQLSLTDLRRKVNPGESVQLAAFEEYRSALALAQAVTDRVLSDGSILDQLSSRDQGPAPDEALSLARRLTLLTQTLKDLRTYAGGQPGSE
jgi:hypothetical protein